jgi:hypothetical protein
MRGHLYIATNPHMPGLVKIGCTNRTSEQRTAELSAATGVPGDYRVERSWLVQDAAALEHRVHAALGAYRIRGSEHFRLSVADAVAQIERLLPAGTTAQPTWRLLLSRLVAALAPIVAPVVSDFAFMQLRRHPTGRQLLGAWSVLSRLRRR